MSTKKVPTTIRFEGKLLDDIDAIAEIENRSRNNLVETWAQKAVDEYKREHGMKADPQRPR